MPCPKMFIATAAQMAGRPTRPATGRRRAPMSTTAGEGQMSQETMSMHRPIPQNAPKGFRMIFLTGRIMSSSMPTVCMALDRAVTRAMTSMMPNSSPLEAMMALFRI